mgnify:CR=1 FL=1
MDSRYTLLDADDLPTPALVFYEGIIRENIALACSIARDPSRLRPHVKTHKTAEISRLEMEAGISRFKCATVAEAEMLAIAGAADVLIAYPLYGKNARRFAALTRRHEKVRFSTIFDSQEGMDGLRAAASREGARFGLFLDVDVGQHRTGIAPTPQAERLYATAASCPEFYMAGLHCYDGHNHQRSVEERRAAAMACYAAMESLRTPLMKRGLPVPEVVMGGTPTFPFYAAMPDVTLSPGTCFLQDLSYMESYPDMAFVPAALIVTRVVSRNAERREFCVDLGYKGVSADPQGPRGKLLNFPDSEPVFQNEEHWVFSARSGELPPPGAIVYALPTHICPTVALYERAYIADPSGKIDAQWKIAARDRVVGI